jgi:hypothetical protein
MADTSPWRIDPDTLDLPGPDRYRRFTAHEFDDQSWPLCLVDGATIKVACISTRNATELEPTFIIGR